MTIAKQSLSEYIQAYNQCHNSKLNTNLAYWKSLGITTADDLIDYQLMLYRY